MGTPYDVIEICNYIISYCNRKDYPISNLKLQKILYFLQAYFLVVTGRSCFPEPIEAWEFGPVVPVAYKCWSAYPFSIPYVFYDPFDDKGQIVMEDRIMIERLVYHLKSFTAYDLTKASMKQSPWRETFKENEEYKVIPNELIKDYFERWRK